ncbi:MAG: ABC transporter ATP-binding protein [Hyphomicrobiales bacterium]|nr:ABC transporter ATP-binding protein [Hyphomicrobiales bacterium]OQW83379.1 MAG: ABC transporter [Proteobacteria bacterium ST_bin15]
MTVIAPLIITDVVRRYAQGTTALTVLDGASMRLEAGEIVALVAPSGAGKSTLLHMAGLLERPDSGDVLIDGAATARLADSERTRLRRNRIGFVYQFHHLLPEFSARENVVLAQQIAGEEIGQARLRADELLAMLGLAKRLHHRPGELSGGEQQRVAIARAIANRPAILLADEPTGNLDPKTAQDVFHTLRDVVRNSSLAALIATHNMDIAAQMDRRVTLLDGKIRSE